MCNFLIYMVELTIPPVRRLTIVTGTPRVAPHACLVQKTSTSQPYGFPLSERIRRRRIHLCRQSSCHASSASTENSPSVAGAPKPLTTMVEVAMLSAFRCVLEYLKQHFICVVPTDGTDACGTHHSPVACSGMAYTLFATVGLEKYVGYFLPLPVVLASGAVL